MSGETNEGDDALRNAMIGALRAKARALVFLLAAAFGVFVYFVADAGKPLWLVMLIGFFGVILIGFFIALVWFWLRFFASFGRKDT